MPKYKLMRDESWPNGRGWPNEDGSFYKCTICNEMLPVEHNQSCECDNLYVEPGSGRAGAKQIQRVEYWRRVVAEMQSGKTT